MGGNSKGHKRRFGAVRRLPSGRFQARYPGPDGLMRTAPYTFERKKDAEQWLIRTEAEILENEWTDPTAGKIPFGEYAQAWLQERTLKVKTRQLYEGLLRLHINSTFESVSVSEIHPHHVRRWHTELAGSVGASTVAKAYRLLRTVLNTAVDDGLIRRNPCRIKGAGVERPDERPVLSVEQVLLLAGKIAPRYRALVLLATFASLRWGELVALRRRNIDLRGRTVQVNESMSELKDGSRVIGAPKSDAGKRTVAIPEAIVPDLRWHLQRFAEPGSSGLVFVGEKGAPLRRSNFSRPWAKALKAAGLPAVHLHDLRHTGNTLAAASGASLRELMSRMGHGSSQAAMVYLHATSDRDRMIADALGSLIETHARDAQQKESG